MTEKLDLAKQLKHLYQPSAKAPVVVEVPALNFLMIDGKGDPNTSQAYAEAISCLYQFSYALKFKIKKSAGIDYAVMPLEGLWWVDDVTRLDMQKKDDWFWTMMIAQPEPVTAASVEQACQEVIVKKGNHLAEKVRFETFQEGTAVEILHMGPYAAEMPTVERLHAFAREQGYQLVGKHHEIYLNDPSRSAPDKLRTVVRQPVER